MDFVDLLVMRREVKSCYNPKTDAQFLEAINEEIGRRAKLLSRREDES